MITKETQGIIFCKGRGCNCYNCKDAKECVDYVEMDGNPFEKHQAPIDIISMTSKQWIEIRKILENRLKEKWYYRSIKRVGRDRIYIEGGRVLLCFDLTSNALEVSERCSKSSGYGVEVDTLIVIQDLCREWRKENF